jgi:hypothetical protein
MMYSKFGSHHSCRPGWISLSLKVLVVLLVAFIFSSPAIANSPSQSSNPAYQWHTFIGTSSGDGANGMAIDKAGYIYVVGISAASWVGPGGVQPLHAHSGGYDITVVKMDSRGYYQWHTFYGSSSTDYGRDIVTDDNGNVYIAAQSNATWQGDENTNPLHAYSADYDAAVLKLDSDGTYQWHTFYGSTDYPEYGYGIALDSQGDLRVEIHSDGAWNGPSEESPLHAFTFGGGNITALKLDDAGAYQWHTFYRGAGSLGVALDSDDNTYLLSLCDVDWNGPSDEIPLHARSGLTDFLVVKLNSSGAYVWHTFYGSSLGETPRDIAVDDNGYIYVVGYGVATWNGPADQPPLHAYNSMADIVVFSLEGDGDYRWHTFYGSNTDDNGISIFVDEQNNLWAAGYSAGSWNGPSADLPLHSFSGGIDLWGLKLTGGGDYQFHTFYGSDGNDYANSGAIKAGSVYLAGTSFASWVGDGGKDPLHAHSGGTNGNMVVVKLQGAQIFLPVIIR